MNEENTFRCGIIFSSCVQIWMCDVTLAALLLAKQISPNAGSDADKKPGPKLWLLFIQD
jgi:hypothetical protein